MEEEFPLLTTQLFLQKQFFMQISHHQLHLSEGEGGRKFAVAAFFARKKKRRQLGNFAKCNSARTHASTNCDYCESEKKTSP